MHRIFGGVWVLLSIACATSRPEKISFTDVLPPRNSEDPSPPSAAATAELSAELQTALARFQYSSRQTRSSSPTGASMPESQVDNWREIVGKMDNFLARKPAETSSFDIIRARVSMEAELEMDGRSYGNFPEELAGMVFERIGKLAQRMALVRQLGVKTKFALTQLRWPIEPVAVTSPFGERFHPIIRSYRPHQGVDLAAEDGQLVMSAASGTILRAEWAGSFGYHVEIQHEGNLTTSYSHLSEIWVDPGDTIKASETIGLAGDTGLSTGPHLHFEVRRNGTPCDPLEEIVMPAETNGKLASL